MFNIIRGIDKSKTYYVNVNVDLMEQNVILINGGITVNGNVSKKTSSLFKKIIFRILLNVVVKMENI